MDDWSRDPDRARRFSDARLAAFQRGDVKSCIAMYRDDAVVVTPQGNLQGAAIAAMMTALFDEFSQPGVTFELISRSSDGDVSYFTWRATTAKMQYDLCAESYLLKDGKIAVQTFTGLMHPR